MDLVILPSLNPTDLEKNIRKCVRLVETEIKKFANGETYINIKENVEGQDVYIVMSGGNDINDNLMEVYLKADAAKRMRANKIIAILPNFPYGRQERKCEMGEPISAKLNMALLKTSGVTDIITVDVHTTALQDFANEINLHNISTIEFMADYFKNRTNTVIVSPDLGGAKRASKLADLLHFPSAIVKKHRIAHNEAIADTLLGDVNGKDCIIFDDIIDTAGTVFEASKLLKAMGANKITICATHGLFNGNAYERLSSNIISEVIVSNSENAQGLYIKRIDISSLIISMMAKISDNMNLKTTKIDLCEI